MVRDPSAEECDLLRRLLASASNKRELSRWIELAAAPLRQQTRGRPIGGKFCAVDRRLLNYACALMVLAPGRGISVNKAVSGAVRVFYAAYGSTIGASPTAVRMRCLARLGSDSWRHNRLIADCRSSRRRPRLARSSAVKILSTLHAHMRHGAKS